MSKDVHIIPLGKGGKALGKEQKRFNALVVRIGELREEIKLAQALDLELRRLGTERIRPAELKAMAAIREWVFRLHRHPFRTNLSNKLAQKFPDIMLGEIATLIRTDAYREDKELTDLYAYYEGSGRSYEEILKEEEEAYKTMATPKQEESDDSDPISEDYDDSSADFEQEEDKKADWEASEREHKEKKAKRPKSKTHLAGEEKREEAAKAVKKSAKQIYMDLVRHFHPDKEPDENLRLEKTEVMKEITNAFEADDHLKLIEMQMSMLTGRENVAASFDDTQLRFFNRTLEQQVQDLQQELFFESPEGNGNPYGALYAPARVRMLQNVDRYISNQKKFERSVRQNLEIIESPRAFREFVQDYELDEDDDFSF
jgi:hypothetical protein